MYQHVGMTFRCANDVVVTPDACPRLPSMQAATVPTPVDFPRFPFTRFNCESTRRYVDSGDTRPIARSRRSRLARRSRSDGVGDDAQR